MKYLYSLAAITFSLMFIAGFFMDKPTELLYLVLANVYSILAKLESK